MSQIDATIVLCTFNRADMLREALESLTQQALGQGRSYEVVVVDNASTDETAEVIAEIAGRSSVSVRGVYEPRRGVACARNRGIAEARGEWIAFCDDDQSADSNWLDSLLAMADKTGARVIGGAVRLRIPDPSRRLSPVLREMMGESYGMDAPRRYSRRNSPGTGNMLIHCTVIQQVGNFDERLTEAGEDTDLFRRIRQAHIDSWYTPDAVVRHVIPAYRLRPNYLKWASQRSGWCFAHRDHKEWSRTRLLLSAAARMGKAAAATIPCLLLAKWRGDAESELGMRCNLWRTEGYLRGTAHLTARVFSQESFLSGLEFRTERQMFADG